MTEAVGDKMKGSCPECRRETNCMVLGAFDQPWSIEDSENSMNGQQDHRLLQCLGCDKVFYQISAWDSEDWDTHFNSVTGEQENYFPTRLTVYPEAERDPTRPKWTTNLHKIDWPLSSIMSETYRSLESRSFILASVGLRTALDRAMQILGIDPGHTLEQKLLSLRDGGFVGATEHEILTLVANAGNAAAHQAWSPDESEFDHLLVALEQFVHRTVVVGQKALDIKNNIPAKQPRPKKVKTEKPALTREPGYDLKIADAFAVVQTSMFGPQPDPK